MTTLGLKVNTKLKATTQLMGYNFNSMCKFNGVVLGANDQGIFTVGGDTMNGAVISSYFKTFSTDFGTDKNKGIRAVTVSGVFTSLLITTVINNTEKSNYSSGKNIVLEQSTQRISINHADTGKYIGLKIANVNGSDFSVDTVAITVGATFKFSSDKAILGRGKSSLSSLT
jgi:hypothetical protein